MQREAKPREAKPSSMLTRLGREGADAAPRHGREGSQHDAGLANHQAQEETDERLRADGALEVPERASEAEQVHAEV